MQYVQLIEHQSHRHKLSHKPRQVGQRPDVIHKAHARNQSHGSQEPRIVKPKKRRPYPQPQHEDNTATTQHYCAVRRPLIRLVDDVTLVRNAEIQKLKG